MVRLKGAALRHRPHQRDTLHVLSVVVVPVVRYTILRFALAPGTIEGKCGLPTLARPMDAEGFYRSV